MAVLKLRRLCDLLRGIQHEKGCHLEAFKRRYSSANPKKESGMLNGQIVELAEVLEVRMHQLQAKNELDLSLNNTTLAVSQGVLNVGHPQETTTQTTTKASEASNTESGLSSAPQPSRWMEKLDKDRWTKQKRQQRLQEQYWHFPVRQGVRKRSDEEVATTGPQKKLTKKSRVMETSVRSPSSKTVSSRSGSTKKGSTESQKLEKLANDAHLAAIEALEEQIRSSGTLSSSPPLNDKQSTTYGNTQLSILAFLEACIFIGALERAQEFLLYYHRFPARRKLLSIKMYDVLLHGWARKGSLQPIGRLFSMMEEAGLKPTLSSYAAALECMGRGNLSPRVIGRCLMQLTNDGLCLEDLLQDCAFQEDERELVLKAIHAVDPEFKPPLLLRKDACTAHLLKDFYCQGNPVSYPKLDFSVADLQERFQRQLALERASTVTIDSVEAVKPLTEQNCKARELLRVLRARWRKSLLRALQDSKIRMGALSDRSQRVNLYPFLCLLEDEEYVDIMMQSISNLPPSGDSLLVVARDLGTQIYNKYCISRKDRTHVVSKMDALYAGYSQLLAKETKVSQ